MVIIVAEPNDIHALVVAKRLFDLGESSCILNSSDYPQRMRINWSTSNKTQGFTISYDDHTLRREEIKGVWLRRLKQFAVAEEVFDKQVQAFVYNECRDLFLGWLYTLDNIINSHQAEAGALLKLYQLHLAREIGLEIPETLISNDPAEIERFYRESKFEVVFKPLTPTSFQFTGTQVMTDEHLNNLTAAALAPCIFQERIKVQRNFRITIVDDKIFVVTIRTDKPQAEVDWRLDFNTVIEPAVVPEQIGEKLLAMNKRLGLRYGAIDMIIDEKGRHVFLENNPGGQFLFAEIHSGLPISSTLAKSLIGSP